MFVSSQKSCTVTRILTENVTPLKVSKIQALPVKPTNLYQLGQATDAQTWPRNAQ